MKLRSAIAATSAAENLNRLSQKLAGFRGYLLPLPATGRLWLDLVYLIVVGAVHFTVFPSLTQSFFVVDLMTPWIVVTMIAQPFPRGALIGAVGALVLETHSVAPAGIYITAFWVIGVVVNLTKSTLSWRHVFPWFVTLVLAEIWVMAFESFVQGIYDTGGTMLRFGPAHLAHESFRLVFSTAFGLLIAHRFMRADLSEGSPHPREDNN